MVGWGHDRDREIGLRFAGSAEKLRASPLQASFRAKSAAAVCEHARGRADSRALPRPRACLRQSGMRQAACERCGELGHETADCMHAGSDLRMTRSASPGPSVYDEAGRALLVRLGATTLMDSPACTRTKSCPCPLCSKSRVHVADAFLRGPKYSRLNRIWPVHHADRGECYVGGIQAAQVHSVLKVGRPAACFLANSSAALDCLARS